MADFDATRLIMERSDESRGDYWKDRAVRAEAELESLAASVMNLSHPNCQMLLRERNEAWAERDVLLVRQKQLFAGGRPLDELLADAERYRWLQDECVDDEPMVDGDSYWVRSVHFEFSSTTTLDAAIDAARSKP